MKSEIPEIPDASDSFARVELYRIQHGELPLEENSKPLDEVKALTILANIIDYGREELMPPRYNVACIIRYAAKHFKK